MFVLADQSKKMDLQELLILTEAENDCEIGLGKKSFFFCSSQDDYGKQKLWFFHPSTCFGLVNNWLSLSFQWKHKEEA